MAMGPEPPKLYEDRCVLCGYGRGVGRLSIVHAECAAHVHEPGPMDPARIMYQEEIAALRERLAQAEEVIETGETMVAMLLHSDGTSDLDVAVEQDYRVALAAFRGEEPKE